MAGLDVVFDEAGFLDLIAGPIEQDLVRRAIRVERQAKHNASGRPGPNVITGRLRDSIHYELGRDSVSPYVDIGSNLHYAPHVELGHNNRAHLYPIMTPGGSFTGQFGRVSDRPTRAYPYLRPALEAGRTT